MHFNNKIYDLQSLKTILSGNPKKIGLLGGSFNPAHHGHVEMSKYALSHFNLDYVIWLISPQNPFKPKYKKTIEERANYAASIIDNSRILISTMEAEIESKYTFKTIEFFGLNFPNHNFIWMMGLDCISSFHLWEYFDKFTEFVDIAIFERPGYLSLAKSVEEIQGLMKSHNHRIILCKNKLVNISSTEIRAKNND
ncbi:MAG: nicotinate (nicotinamide) nucleotide adenylyltransferase [Rickettsiaceae bacterium]|nr:nicotinate (nicotinamide) nucleotide adenylyltransferase [Rickettsiaceae bacterium]